MPASQILIPVLNCCLKDWESAVYNLRVCAKLDGQLDSTLLLATDISFLSHPDFGQVLTAAQAAFKRIDIFRYSQPISQDWPAPQNHAWQQVARHLDRSSYKFKAWLWWEPDCIPLQRGWLQTLTDAYIRGKKPFAGVPLTGPDGRLYLNGVAVYPLKVLEPLCDTPALYVREYPFDQMASRGVAKVGYTDLSKLIIHHLKQEGGGGGRSFTTLRDLDNSTPTAILYHGCTDLSLQRLILGEKLPAQQRLVTPAVKPPTGTGRNTFYHSGDLGDIIYSLPTVRELGGGDLYLGPDNRTTMSVREKMDVSRCKIIQPLLEAQPFIHSVSHQPVLPEVTYDLNQMRQLLRSHRLDMQPGFNLARCYLKAFGLSLDNDQAPWLSVPSPVQVAPVLIARSPRYHNPVFNWAKILSHYRGQCVFVGLLSEHSAFESEHGRIPFHPTSNLLDLAQVIAGCELFIGNQSCPFAIAEGLKKPVILEPCPGNSNTIFKRPDAIVGCGAGTELPIPLSVKSTRVKLTRSLTIRGPIDYFTGLGRITCQLINGFVSRKFKVAVQPTSFDERLALPVSVKKLVRDTTRFTPPTLVISPLLDVAKNVKPGDSLLTMWESTVLPPGVVQIINSRASQLIVPSSWCATVFSANGITIPIKIVPLGVDTSIYKPAAKKPQGILTLFGAAGRLAHGGTRKGIEDVITAFTQAFPDPKTAAGLSLKLCADCKVPTFNDPRILVDKEWKTDEEMAQWYNDLDCFVCASKAEGWGLHVQEALACGTPVLASCYSGLADMSYDGITPIPFDIVEAGEGYQGHWCQIRVDLLSLYMKGVASKSTSLLLNKPASQELLTDVNDMVAQVERALA